MPFKALDGGTCRLLFPTGGLFSTLLWETAQFFFGGPAEVTVYGGSSFHVNAKKTVDCVFCVAFISDCVQGGYD